MNFHEITHDDLKNGEGLRVTLWLAGCNHYCEGCQNPVTWDANDGLLFDEFAEQELFKWLDEDYCAGLTLSGGDPMYPGNRDDVLKLCIKFRERYADKKTIWMYTGYRIGELKGEPVLDYVDVILDGEYKQDLRNVNRQWVGSENQIIWRKMGGMWIADPPMYTGTLNGEWHEKKKGCC